MGKRRLPKEASEKQERELKRSRSESLLDQLDLMSFNPYQDSKFNGDSMLYCLFMIQ